MIVSNDASAKRKAEQASKLGVDARKKQRLSLESVELIPVAVEMASSSSGRVEDVASHLSETSDISATLSVPTSGGQGFQGQVEGTADTEEMLESIAPEARRAETGKSRDWCGHGHCHGYWT